MSEVATLLTSLFWKDEVIDMASERSCSVTMSDHRAGHRCRSRQIFGGAKEFCLYSRKRARKIRQTSGLQKKALHVKSGTISCQFGRHYFQIKACWAPFLLRFSGSFRRFSEISPGFFVFSPNQNFWGCASNPASYTSGVGSQYYNSFVTILDGSGALAL